MDKEVKADRCAMHAANKSRIRGTKTVPTAIADPLEAGGVKAAELGASKGRLHRNASTVAEKATKKVSAGRRGLIWTKLDRIGKTRIDVIDHTSPEARREPGRDRPS